MSNANTLNPNARPVRKTLSSQLDRLDEIIDSLSQGLHGAVMDEVRAAITVAVTEAVTVVLREVLGHPELLRQLTGQVAPQPAPAPAQPSVSAGRSKLKQLCQSVKAKLSTGWRWMRNKFVSVCKWVGRKLCALPTIIRTKISAGRVKLTGKLRGLFRGVGETARKAWNLRRPVSMSLGIGLVVGGIGYIAGPVVSALALGLCGSTISLASFVLAPFVRLWRGLKAQSA